MAFDYQALVDAVQSYAEQTGVFENPVATHEPKSRPGPGVTCSTWVEEISPIPAASGLNAVTGLVTMTVRLQTPFIQQPADQIDPTLMRAVGAVMGQFGGGFTLGNVVRNVDLLGMHSQGLRARAGHVNQDGTNYRAMDISLPLIVNDLYGEAP
jgi:hypothetical protein